MGHTLEMQEILSGRLDMLLDLGFKTMFPIQQGDKSNSYSFVGRVLQFHFWSCKAFFFGERSTELDKQLKKLQFCKLVFSSKKYFVKK